MKNQPTTIRGILLGSGAALTLLALLFGSAPITQAETVDGTATSTTSMATTTDTGTGTASTTSLTDNMTASTTDASSTASTTGTTTGSGGRVASTTLDFFLSASSSAATTTVNNPLTISFWANNYGPGYPMGNIDVELFDGSGHLVKQAVVAHEWSTNNLQKYEWPVTPTSTGMYSLNLGAFNNNWSTLYKWVQNALTFEVTDASTTATSTNNMATSTATTTNPTTTGTTTDMMGTSTASTTTSTTGTTTDMTAGMGTTTATSTGSMATTTATTTGMTTGMGTTTNMTTGTSTASTTPGMTGTTTDMTGMGTTTATSTGGTMASSTNSTASSTSTTTNATGSSGASTGGMTTTTTPSANQKYPNMSIWPNSITVSPGQHVDFNGRNFPIEENIHVMMNGSQIGNAHADGGGNFSTGSIVAPYTAGMYTYTFVGATSGTSISSHVTVQ